MFEKVAEFPDLPSMPVVRFSPDDRELVVAATAEVRIMEVSTWRNRRSLPLEEKHDLLVLSRDGRMLRAADSDGSLQIWNLAQGRLRWARRFPGFSVGLVFSSDEKTIALVSYRDSVWSLRFWDIDQDREVLDFLPGLTCSGTCVFSPDGKALAVKSGKGKTIDLWDLKLKVRQAVLPGLAQPLLSNLEFSPDSSRLAAVSAEGELVLWDAQKSKVLLNRQLQTGGFSLATFAPTGKLLAVGGNAPDPITGLPVGELILLSLPSGEELGRLGGLGRWNVSSAAFSGNGQYLALSATGLGVVVYRLHLPLAHAAGPCYRYRLRGTAAGRVALPAEALHRHFSALRSKDAAEAFLSIEALSTASDSTLPYLKQRLQPAARIDADRFARLVADLDSPRKATRGVAREAMVDLGGRSLLLLRQQLEAGPPTPGVIDLLEQLVAERSRLLTPDELQVIRAVEVLERIGSREARALLENLASGGAGDLLTEEARSAMARLALE